MRERTMASSRLSASKCMTQNGAPRFRGAVRALRRRMPDVHFQDESAELAWLVHARKLAASARFSTRNLCRDARSGSLQRMIRRFVHLCEASDAERQEGFRITIAAPMKALERQ